MWGNKILDDLDEFQAEFFQAELVLDDTVWDVFKLDDETAEPEPQYGDFWWQPCDDER